MGFPRYQSGSYLGFGFRFFFFGGGEGGGASRI